MSEGEDDEEDAGSDEEGDNPFSGESCSFAFAFILLTEWKPLWYLLCAIIKKNLSFYWSPIRPESTEHTQRMIMFISIRGK